jgi:aspartate beta-hydroxylase
MAAIYDRVCGVGRKIFRRRIEGPPVLDPSLFFPHAPLFTGAWQAIRDEALAVAGRLHAVPRFEELMREQAPIAAHDPQDWRMFILKAYGSEIAPNMARCPTLASLLRQSPEVLSAVISFLAPGKHVPRHCGPFRGVLRFHLGLSMPRGGDGRPAAVLRIEDREHRLADGDSLLWDDTYPHEVWNPADEVRIALLLDVWRPGMPMDMELLSRLVVAVVQIGMRCRAVSHGT